MPEIPEGSRPHLVLKDTSTAQPFTPRGSGGGNPIGVPERDRRLHGQELRSTLRSAAQDTLNESDIQLREEMEGGLGLQVSFVGFPDVRLAIEQLANDTHGIELMSIRQYGEVTVANVFVPDGKLEHFEKYITAYIEKKTKSNGMPNDHAKLLNTIQTIRAAELQALWTDVSDLFPQTVDESIWWEVWLPVRKKREAVLSDFRKLALNANCTVSDGHADFPERTVVLVFGSRNQMTQSALMLNCVAELRRAKKTAEFFDGMRVEEQRDCMKDALRRLAVAENQADAPRICLIDSGVNRAHPMLEPLMDPADLHSVNPNWDVGDSANHGTGLAGLAVYGDLTHVLSSSEPINVSHRLESSKIIEECQSSGGNSQLYACLFTEAISRPEISAPKRLRVFTSAVTASDNRDRGRPSSWSAMVDQLAADADNGGESPRLIVLAAGNSSDPAAWLEYPSSISTNPIHDPGQAWNALSVGACTELTLTELEGLQAIANSGGISPYSTSSSVWDKAWPMKPDIVFEGGNVGRNELGPVQHVPLSLLTTNADHLNRLFTTSNATSAASALCARLAAQIMSVYPHLWPETVRGIVVHSAKWTDDMRKMYLNGNGSANKNAIENLVRHCGWGIPDHSRAMWSLSNSLTLVTEDELHPYVKKQGNEIKTRDMNLHTLPWPKEQLEALQNTRVTMRVTLSYFIEPNPSARGGSSKYHYPSHRLRFDVKRATENDNEFAARINKAASLEDEVGTSTSDSKWLFGIQNRHRGSLHQDEWEGTAADLAARGTIAVYPANGWWRTRPKMKKFDQPARYSLIVSIRAEQNEVDLYSAIVSQIKTPVLTSIDLQNL
ncbi:S8 family peptidase [soil metagenome]